MIQVSCLQTGYPPERVNNSCYLTCCDLMINSEYLFHPVLFGQKDKHQVKSLASWLK